MMEIASSTTDTAAENEVFHVSVCRDGQPDITQPLTPGNCVLIGTSAVCGIRVSDPRLSPIHCAVRWEDSGLVVEDWNSDQGVTVDGARISAETGVRAASRIEAAGIRVRICDVENEARRDAPVEDAVASPSPPADARVAPVPPSAEPPAMTEFSRDAATPSFRDAAAVNEEKDELLVLRAEVEQLRYELAERDAQLTELAAWDADTLDDDDDLDADSMLLRLEDLLNELQRNDERCVLLENLLQAAEEKNRAEQDERKHLAAWIDDIEARLGERELDWKSEREALEVRVETLLSEREELMQQLAATSAPATQGSGAAHAADHGAAASDREINVQLRQQLHEMEESRLQLEEAVRERDRQLVARSETESALRAEHLKLAQERAALARQQAELASVQTEVEHMPNRPETEIDCRLREFRQHLREIHQEEQQNPRKMSSRLADIWSRIESRL